MAFFASGPVICGSVFVEVVRCRSTTLATRLPLSCSLLHFAFCTWHATLSSYAFFWLLLAFSRSDLPRDVVAPGLRWPLSFSWLLLAFRKKLSASRCCCPWTPLASFWFSVALGLLQEVSLPRDVVAPGLRWRYVCRTWLLLALCKK